VEATVNRVGDRWTDQLRLTGHHDRLDDLDRFAELGLSAIRYPVLWERTETAPGRFDWDWPDARMARLRALGTAPIVGLVHHGSGPAWTDLLDPGFAPGLAAFAGRVARRYPWARDWTPVNEPLTTARFAALYGHWHPHRRDEGAFWLALLNQIDAVRLSMRAIREAVPQARLVQTEDFGRTFGTAPCAAQVAHENERRLMTWDLLCGRVVPGHPLRERLERLGFGPRLDAIAADAYPPDVVGMNHYATSDRWLDHRLDRHPPRLHGGNGRIAYADTEAVRARPEPPHGWAAHLRTLWRRYRLPLAVTECHLGCTREEQLRWFAECWADACALAARGVPVEAVTTWALVGSKGWNTLLTEPGGLYESGAFDVSTGVPRPTALAALVRDLARGLPPPPLARQAGWWRRGRVGPGDPEADDPADDGFLVHACHPAADRIVALCRLRGLSVTVAPRGGDHDPGALIDPPQDARHETEIHRLIDLMLDRRLCA
jgi:dTDP-4-dehydrorhamnose reductase